MKEGSREKKIQANPQVSSSRLRFAAGQGSRGGVASSFDKIFGPSLSLLDFKLSLLVFSLICSNYLSFSSSVLLDLCNISKLHSLFTEPVASRSRVLSRRRY